MSAPQDDPVVGTSPDDSRSGADIAEAIDVAEEGSRVEPPHDRGQTDTTGAAPVEQVRGDAEMTQGQVVHGPGSDEGTATGGAAEGVSSGAAQSVRGARPVDQASADGS